FGAQLLVRGLPLDQRDVVTRGCRGAADCGELVGGEAFGAARHGGDDPRGELVDGALDHGDHHVGLQAAGVALDDLDTRLPAGRHRLGETIVDGDAHGCIAIGYVVVDLVGGHVLHGDVHDIEPGQDVNDGGRERIVGGDTGRD